MNFHKMGILNGVPILFFIYTLKHMNKTQKGFDIRSASPVDARFQFDTIGEMKRYNPSKIPAGCITYCKEDKTHYKFVLNHTFGEWEPFLNWQIWSREQYDATTEKPANTLIWIYE